MAKHALPMALNDVPSEYDKLTPGVHNVEITAGTIEHSKSTPGEEVAVYAFVVLDGADAGKHNKVYISLHKKALWKARQFRDAAGVNDGNSPEYDTEPYIGRRLKIQVGNEPYADQKTGRTEMRTAVQDFFPFA